MVMEISSIIQLIAAGAGAVDGAVKAVKGAKELLKSEPSATQSVSAANEKLNEALEQMIEVREARLAVLEAAISLQAEKAAFDARVSALDTFAENSSKYELKSIGPNSLAYVAKETTGKPLHYVCVPCFDDRKISILQQEERHFGHDKLRCSRCSALVQCDNDIRAEVVLVPRRRDDYLHSGWNDL